MAISARCTHWLVLSMLTLAAACHGADSNTYEVVVSRDAPEAVRIAAADVVQYLEGMGAHARLERRTTGQYECVEGVRRIVIAGDGVDEPTFEATATDQTFHVESMACGTGRFARLSGGGLLGRQYAVYEWLRALGVRFFHPEQEFVPETLVWPADFERVHTPAFRDRSVSLHLTHPLELGDAFYGADATFADEGRRYIDWQIKNLASLGTTGVGTGTLADYGLRRGFPAQTGLRLYGQQQGSTGILDPDSGVPWETQIADAIEARMNPTTGEVPTRMSVSFDPSEFTQEPDQIVVAQLTFIANYMTEHYPAVNVSAINHGTHSEPTPTYGVRYYDLPKFAPATMGVRVHPLMFYDLFRPAPVYGNTDFNHLYDFMEEQSPTRELTYFPESAWWLTFDIAVPLYLPITVEARDRDIQGLRHMLAGGLRGHHVFGTGHEWGYWQNEYCSFRMASDLEFRWQDCFRDITSTFGEAGPEAQAVLEEVVARQQSFMFDADAIRWLVGTDSETEAAAAIGVSLHPLPPAPEQILAWSDVEIARFETVDEPRLAAIANDFSEFAYRLANVRDQVPERSRPFFDEILDGLEIFGVRARHQLEVYGGLVRLRESQLTGSSQLREESAMLLSAALGSTEYARSIVERREAGYRYLPLARSIAGGPRGGEDDNWSTYHYRVLNRTHHVFYFASIDERAASAVAVANVPYLVDDAIVPLGSSHVVHIVDPAVTSPMISWGDGATESALTSFSHAYAVAGTFDAELSGMHEGGPLAETIPLACVTLEYGTGFTGAVVEPAGADLIESLLPALVFGDAGPGVVALGFTPRADGAVASALWQALAVDPAAPTTTTVATDVLVPIINKNASSVYARILVQGLVLEHVAPGAVQLSGQLSVDSVVAALVTVGNGAFDDPGARAIIASTLGYTTGTLPPAVPFTVSYTVTP